MPTCLSPIVGLQFRSLSDKAELALSRPGSPLQLDPEPDNQYDPNAIRVLSGQFCFGYLPTPQTIAKFPSDLNYASNVTILSILAASPDHSACLQFDATGLPLVSLTWS
jgi:hypothetical protein